MLREVDAEQLLLPREELLARRFRWSGELLRVITGLLSVAFGLYVMYQVGLVDGLFRA